MVLVTATPRSARMTTEEFIIDLFWRVDPEMQDVPKHPQAKLYPSEVVTLALLFALKGVGPRAFYRWLVRDYHPLFPKLPHRTRLFRLFASHRAWPDYFLAEPTVLGVADSYGIELLHPLREGRRARQIGRKGKSNGRWIVGGKLAYLVNQWGLIVAWDCGTANLHDTAFHGLIADVQDEMVVLTDTGFHAKDGVPPNMKPCPRGTWNVRMGVETVLSMLTTICHFKRISQRTWHYFMTRLAFTMALFNVLVQWDGLEPAEDGVIHLSIAQFSL
jgi:hypothetical protein